MGLAEALLCLKYHKKYLNQWLTTTIPLMAINVFSSMFHQLSAIQIRLIQYSTNTVLPFTAF